MGARLCLVFTIVGILAGTSVARAGRDGAERDLDRAAAAEAAGRCDEMEGILRLRAAEHGGIDDRTIDARVRECVARVPVIRPKRGRTRRYGLAVFAVDVLAAGTVAIAPALAMVAAVVYLAGGPTIHVLHGNWKGASKSLVTRLLLPVITAGVAIGSTSAVGSTAVVGAWVGAGVGAITASALDAGVFAKITPQPGGALIGLASRF
jgi:hypothetical protein